MMSDSRKKVLVTGGTGFIGNHLCAALLSCGYDVVVLTRNSGPVKPGVATFYINSLEEIEDEIGARCRRDPNDIRTFDKLERRDIGLSYKIIVLLSFHYCLYYY